MEDGIASIVLYGGWYCIDGIVWMVLYRWYEFVLPLLVSLPSLPICFYHLTSYLSPDGTTINIMLLCYYVIDKESGKSLALSLCL